MIRIEDACKVCRQMMIEYGNCEMDEEIEVLIKQEMEQKMWITGCSGKAREVLEDIYDRITDIHPKMIAEAIKEDGLKDWCKKTQVALNMLLVKLPIKHEE